MIIVHAIIIALFIILGIVFLRGKGAFLIAGYNTLSAAGKEKYDEKALCGFVGKSMFVLAACWVVISLSAVIDSMVPLWIGMGLFAAAIIFNIVYANTGNRFRK